MTGPGSWLCACAGTSSRADGPRGLQASFWPLWLKKSTGRLLQRLEKPRMHPERLQNAKVSRVFLGFGIECQCSPHSDDISVVFPVGSILSLPKG